MANLKIALIGVGSASFGIAAIRDAANMPEVYGATLALMDVNAERLDIMTRIANLVNEDTQAGFKIESYQDRREALKDADYVIASISIERNELWRMDFTVPIKHGIKQILGENGGPGGLFHTMRMVQPMLDIARDMENLCPDALLINFTNPLSRVCRAIARHTKVKMVGLCHGIWIQVNNLAPVLGISPQNIEVTAAGLNHITWILELSNRETGEDLYPVLKERLKNFDPEFQPLCRHLFAEYGLYPSPDDSHVGEYISYAHEFTGLQGYNFEEDERNRIVQNMQLLRWINGEESVRPLSIRPSGEAAFPIIAAILNNSKERIWAVNIQNDGGLIENLPEYAMVEAPAVIDAKGIHGEKIGKLPEPIASLLRQQIEVQEKAVEAAISGSYEAALQALMLDPVVNQDRDAAEKTLKALWKLEQKYLPPMIG